MKCPGSRGSSCYWRDVAGNYSTIPQLFRENGYFSASFGKTFDPRTSDECDATYSWSQPPVLCSTQGTNVPTEHQSHLGVGTKEEDSLIDVGIAKGATDFLASYTKGQQNTSSPRPFFLAVGFHRPHLPFVVPQRLVDQYYPADMPQLQPAQGWATSGHGVPHMGWTGSNELLHYRYTANETFKPYAGKDDNSTLGTAKAAELRRYYFASVTHTDEMVGRVVQALENLGLSNDTVVSFVGDHGWHLSENNLFGKCTNYEVGTRVPMMVSVPGVTSGRVDSHSLVETVDLMPTVMEAAGLSAPPVCPASVHPQPDVCTEGVSFLPLATAPQRVLKTAAFSQYPVPGCGGPSCGADPSKNATLVHPSHMGYTMRTAAGERFTEWAAMAYGADGAFQPQWGAVGLNPPVVPGAFCSAPGSRFELYNHTADPEEKVNLALFPTASTLARMRELQKELHAGWRSAVVSHHK